jgi:hypothetical protein
MFSNLAGLLNDIETPIVATPSTGTIASNWAFLRRLTPKWLGLEKTSVKVSTGN